MTQHEAAVHHRFTLGSLLLCLGLLANPACEGAPKDDCRCPAATLINCGHRGTGSNAPDNPYPENTIPSLLQAAAEGADMVELDVQHSADFELMVIHDDRVNRTTDGTGCVGDLTVAGLQVLDAARGTSMEGEGVVIPTFAEVLTAVDLPINIEIKMSGGACPSSDKDRLAADVVAAIAADGGGRELVVSSFNFEVLEKIQALDPAVPLGYLTLAASDAGEAAAAGFTALNLFDLLLTEEQVAAIADQGLDVNVWTVNDPGRFSMLLQAGVQMIITDEPDLLAQVRGDYCNSYCPIAAD